MWRRKIRGEAEGPEVGKGDPERVVRTGPCCSQHNMPNANLDESSWQVRAADAYAETQAKIPAAWRIDERLLAPAWIDATEDFEKVEKRVDHVLEQSGILSQAELDLVHTDVTTLVAKLQSGQLTAVETVTGESENSRLWRPFACSPSLPCSFLQIRRDRTAVVPMLHRALLRSSACEGEKAGRRSPRNREDIGTFARSARQPQR